MGVAIARARRAEVGESLLYTHRANGHSVEVNGRTASDRFLAVRR